VSDQAPAKMHVTNRPLELLELAGRAAMELGCRPPCKFQTVPGDRPTFHAPRSRAELKLVENPK
jgi:hypothetical protein